MIHVLAQDLKTLLGRIGSWPCDFGPDVAQQLYNVAAQNLPPNGIAADLTPSAGKSTIILSAAAFRNNAKVVALVDKASVHPMEELWLSRAYKLFKMKDTCTLAEKIQNMDADLIVVRGNEKMARDVYSEGLKQDGILFGINLEKLDGVAPEAAGPGWACWRKPKIQVVRPINTLTDKLPHDGKIEKKEPILLGEPMPNGVITDAIVISEEEAAERRKEADGRQG